MNQPRVQVGVRADGRRHTMPPIACLQKAAKQVRIMIVDVQAMLRRGLQVLVDSRPGWRAVAEVTSGKEAIARAKELRPDIVIMDVSMPEPDGLDGLDVTREILRVSPLTQILILSVQDSPEIIRKVLSAGARGYMLKSDPERDLIAGVETLCRNKRFFSPRVGELVLESYVKEAAKKIQGHFQDELTLREKEVLRQLAGGQSNKEVAAGLGISVRTAETHRATIMKKLRARSFSELVRYAVRNRLVEA